MRHRISRKTLAQFPDLVSETIACVGKEFNIKSFTSEIKPVGFEIYHSEGSRYWYVYADQTAVREIVGSSTVGGNGHHAIGACVAFPVGTTIIEVSYYQGYYMTIYNISDPQICT